MIAAEYVWKKISLKLVKKKIESLPPFDPKGGDNKGGDSKGGSDSKGGDSKGGSGGGGGVADKIKGNRSNILYYSPYYLVLHEIPL